MPDGRLLTENFTTYDAHGNEMVKHETNLVGMNLTWTTTHTYDKNGNWLTRHTVTSPGKHYESYSVREISYY
jgi:hypothetical protein